MNYDLNNHRVNTMLLSDSLQNEIKFLVFAAMLLFLVPASVFAEQTIFSSTDEAANQLYEAIEQKNTLAVKKLLGTEYFHLLPLDDVDEQDRQSFIESWKTSHQLIANEKNQYFIKVGKKGWTFPIPLIKENSGWRFDTETGIDEIRIRRIGKNELSAMQAVLAYYDAQKEYAEQDRNGDGSLEYARKFISTDGKKDGLYWPVEAGAPSSPLGMLFANKIPEQSYHGYYYKILQAQGPNAHGGAYSYLIGERMKSGFALIAWPAEYGDSAVMSFMISHNGVLYEKNLGPESDQIAEKMQAFDLDSSWVISEESP
ncbi:MAG: DUF2950 domain-containing protein [Gammaproteobacteria bacterium]|nr:DUF2950 domain-containing protein [Gammaproteobacteria bacterium]